MASLKSRLIVFMALIALSMDAVHCLMCHTCSGTLYLCKDDEKGESKECKLMEMTLGGKRWNTSAIDKMIEWSCWKAVAKGDKTHIFRACSLKMNDTCIKATINDVEGESCFCNEDNCNGAGGQRGLTSIQISLVSILTFISASIVSESNRNSLLAILLSLATVLLMNGVDCLKCYSCGDYTCSPGEIGESIECGVVGGEHNASIGWSCLKRQHKIARKITYVRSCTPKKEDGCVEEVTTKSGNVKDCYCNEDNCNGNGNGTGGIRGWTSVQIWIVSLFTFVTAPIISLVGR